MDDNIAKLSKCVKENTLENWRKTLPAFRLKDEPSRQAWDTYTNGCFNPHSREVARFVANWASQIDAKIPFSRDSNLIGSGRHGVARVPSPDLRLDEIIFLEAMPKASKAGITTLASYRESLELMKKFSIWGDNVAKWDEIGKRWPLLDM